jgi:hypothetical protein
VVDPELDHRLSLELSGLKRGLAAVRAARVDGLEREHKAAQVLVFRRGSKIDAVRDLVGAMGLRGLLLGLH